MRHRVAEVLSKNNINVRTMTLQDRGEFALMRLIVDKPEHAYLALTDNKFACALKEIVAISIDDKPGSFLKLSDIFFKNNINIPDAYGFVIKPDKEAVFCVEVKDMHMMRAILDKEGFKILDDQRLSKF
ncbi:MAG: hypothetical protein V1893_02400 [Candidatus Omnitrophota bacterium]